jgi:hypothetical protein
MEHKLKEASKVVLSINISWKNWIVMMMMYKLMQEI